MTSTLVFEGDGRIEEYVGGYEDWQRHKQLLAQAVAKPGADVLATAGRRSETARKGEALVQRAP